jgi:hypothetical protein
MARFVTKLGNLGTIKTSSLQPYFSAVNNFNNDHGREPVALGDLVARVRKGLATSHVILTFACAHPHTIIGQSCPKRNGTSGGYLPSTTAARYYGRTASQNRVAMTMCRYHGFISLLLTRWRKK